VNEHGCIVTRELNGDVVVHGLEAYALPAVVNAMSTNVTAQGSTGDHGRSEARLEPPANPGLPDTHHNEASWRGHSDRF
jgi:hypothetical protein